VYSNEAGPSGTIPLLLHPLESIDGETPSVTPLRSLPQRRVLKLVRGDQGREQNKPLIATGVSPTGETVVLVTENQFWVYRLSTSRLDSVRPKFGGKFEKDGRLKSGLASLPLRDNGHLMSDNQKMHFRCVAVIEDFVAIGGDGGCLIFSIRNEDRHPCKCVVRLERPCLNVRKIFFNRQGTELTVLFGGPGLENEYCQIYTIAELTELAQTSAEPEPEPPHQLLLLNMTYQIGHQVYSYTTRDAAFSQDGSRIVTCTNHVYGSALIFILSKHHNNSWQILGRHCLVNQELDMMDDDCLGYTGVSL
jgi:hypothetical protein